MRTDGHLKHRLVPQVSLCLCKYDHCRLDSCLFWVQSACANSIYKLLSPLFSFEELEPNHRLLLFIYFT